MIGRERLIFLRLAEVMLPGEKITPDLADRADLWLSRSEGIVRLFVRFSLLLFEWGTFLFRTAGSVEHFCLLSQRGKARYMRFWAHHKVAVMRQIFTMLRMLVVSVHYDDPRVNARWARP